MRRTTPREISRSTGAMSSPVPDQAMSIGTRADSDAQRRTLIGSRRPSRSCAAEPPRGCPLPAMRAARRAH